MAEKIEGIAEFEDVEGVRTWTAEGSKAHEAHKARKAAEKVDGKPEIKQLPAKVDPKL